MEKIEKTQLVSPSLRLSVKTGLFGINYVFYKLLIFTIFFYFAVVTVQNLYLSRDRATVQCLESCLEQEDSSLKTERETHKNQSKSKSKSKSQNPNENLPHNNGSLFDFLLPKQSWLNIDLQMRYLINNDVCSSFPAQSSGEILIVNLVQTGGNNRKNRDAIRSSMPKEELKRLGIRRIFLLARPKPESPPDSSSSKKIPLPTSKTTRVQIKDLMLENDEHADLLVGDFLDTYKNLTYKTLMGLDWATKFCPQAKFIIKNDDDILVDFYQLSLLLSNSLPSSSSSSSSFKSSEVSPVSIKKLDMGSDDQALEFVSSIKEKLSPSTPDKRFIMGSFLNRVIERSQESKFYISFEEFPQKEWPTYSCGMGYVTTVETARDLVEESKKTKFFWIEDVFTTGFLREKRNIDFISMGSLTTYYTDRLECCTSKYREKTNKLDHQLHLDILNSTTNNNNNQSRNNNIPDFLHPRWCHNLFGQIDTQDFSIFPSYMTHAKFCYDSNLCKRWEHVEDQIEKCDAVNKQK